MNAAAIVQLLVSLAPLLEEAIPALEEGAKLLGNAVPAGSLKDIFTHGQELMQRVDPLKDAIEKFGQALRDHKAQAQALADPKVD